MASRCYNGDRGSQETQGEYPLVLRMPGERGTKLLVDAQRVSVGPFGQRLGKSLPAGSEDCTNETIRRMQAEMKEMRQVIMANNIKMRAHMADEVSSEVTAIR